MKKDIDYISVLFCRRKNFPFIYAMNKSYSEMYPFMLGQMLKLAMKRVSKSIIKIEKVPPK